MSEKKHVLRAGDRSPLYVQLKEAIVRDIVEGRRAPGAKMPPTFELAEHYGVCHKTVQAAMRALSREGLVTRRPRHGTFIAPIRLETLRKAVGEPRVALLMRYSGEEFRGSLFVREIVDGVMAAAQKCGCRLDFSVYSNSDSLAIERSVHGFLLMMPQRDEALRFKALGKPTILLDISHPRTGLGFVHTDNIWGIKQAVRHLVGLGHRRVLYVHNHLEDGTSFSAAQRFRGFRIAARRYGLPEESHMAHVSGLDRRLDQRDFTAILTDGYDATIRVLKALSARSIRFPDDVSFVGFDDVEMAEHMPSPLTVVRQRLEAVGMTGLESLLDPDVDWRRLKVLVKPELIIRNSTKRASDPRQRR